MHYHHLSVGEREEIQLGLWQNVSIRSLAKRLKRSPSSLAREIQRNLPPERRQYTPRVAHERALEHRSFRGRTERLKSDCIRTYAVAKLKAGFSPEQIAGRIRSDLHVRISHEAIYQFIYAQIRRRGNGSVKPGCEDLRPYLKRRHKRRAKKGMRKGQRVSKPNGPSIDERPVIVETSSRAQPERRSRIGLRPCPRTAAVRSPSTTGRRTGSGKTLKKLRASAVSLLIRIIRGNGRRMKTPTALSAGTRSEEPISV